MKIFSDKVFLLITGASQGIGEQIAKSFAPLLPAESQVLLLARNGESLNRVKQELPNNLMVNTVSVDLSCASAENLTEIFRNSVKEENISQFSEAVIIHNAGSLGNISQKTLDMLDFDVWRKYYDLNVFSPSVLNNVFVKFFNGRVKKKIFVINITSLCALEPMKSMGYYCSGKAAREMFFKVFAKENPDINVLNYSPGPVKTDMFHDVCKNVGDFEVKESFNELNVKNTVLTTLQTVNRLLKVLEEQKYVSGDHIDYYDSL
ncbi:sepiapterin reductase [Leptopilina heterotoma]|uniref:sepiapterin reductase n=1 Tax=Leptopilina heterotoma TaxID=63436 RepID=UPI001CA9E5A7|nr:sepiapterin reductase [Leptopilina heterotoma]